MIHHIARASEWDAALRAGVLQTSTLGATIDEVGFLHAADSYEQASRVVRYLFGSVEGPLVLLDLDPATFGAHGLRLVHENASPSDPSSERFPHVYGGAVPLDCVAMVQHFATTADLLAVLDRGERRAPETRVSVPA